MIMISNEPSSVSDDNIPYVVINNKVLNNRLSKIDVKKETSHNKKPKHLVKSINGNMINTHRVEVALNVMRKSNLYSKISLLDNMSIMKYNRYDHTYTIKDKIISNLPYSEVKPIDMRSISDIKQEAHYNYHTFTEKSKNEAKLYVKPKFRRMYGNYIEKIKQEELDRLKQEKMKRKYTRRLKYNQLKSQLHLTYDDNKDDNNDNNKDLNEDIDKFEDVLPDSNNDVDNYSKSYSNLFLQLPNHDDSNIIEDNDNINNIINDKYNQTPTLSVKLKNKIRQSIKYDEKIQNVLKKKELLNTMKEQELLQKLNVRETRLLVKNQREQLVQCQSSWLTIISHMMILRKWVKKLNIHRKQQLVLQEKQISKKAILLIERWWFREKIRLAVKKNPVQSTILRIAISRIHLNFQIKRRKKAVNTIILFLRESSIASESLRKLYNYRNKAIKIQKYIRSWIAVQHARIELLWLAFDKIIKNDIELAIKARNYYQRQAILSTMQSGAFSKTAIEINKIKNEVKRTYKKENKIMQRLAKIIEKQEEEKRIMKDEIFKINDRKSQKLYKNISLNQNNTSNINDSLNNSLTNTPIMSPYSRQKKKSFFSKMILNPVNQNKINNLRYILKHQRKRHMLMVALEENSKRHRLKDGLVNIEGLKKFLKDPFNHDHVHEAMDIKFEDTPETILVWRRRIRKKFLLLTQGGYDALQMYKVDIQNDVIIGAVVKVNSDNLTDTYTNNNNEIYNNIESKDSLKSTNMSNLYS